MFQLFQATLQGRRASKTGCPKTYVVSLVQSQKDFTFMKELIESGRVKPIIDKYYPLNETSEAFWYFEKEHAQGKVVITVERDNKY